MKFEKSINRLSTICRNLGKIVSDPYRKSLPKISYEFICCCFFNRCIALHYLSSFLYRKDINNIFDYVSRKEEKEVQDKVNHQAVGNLIANKLSFAEHFGRGGFPVPRLLAYSVLDKMYLKRPDDWRIFNLISPGSFKSALENLMKINNIEEIFLKPIQGTQGIGAYKIKRIELDYPHKLEKLHYILINNSYVYQEVVQQHPDLDKLNESSLNTMRIDTFRLPREKAEILSAFLRVGGRGNSVDNVSAGGLLVGINLDSGKLKEFGLNFFHGSHNFGKFLGIPTSGIVFDGYQVPLFDKVKQIVTQAAEFIPSSIVGWDVAVGDNGPVLIEANCLYYGLSSSDIAYGGYRKNKVYQKALAYAKSR